MLRFPRWMVCCYALCAAAACGRAGAPTLPNGHKLAIMVAFDRTIPADTPPDKAAQLQQVADWMEPDLIEVLRKTGYDAAAVASMDTATGPGRYLLKVHIVNYSGGSKAARMFVGFGAGAARLDASYELIGLNGTSYVTGTPSVSTSRVDWQRVARKVNEQIRDAVTVRLRQGL